MKLFSEFKKNEVCGLTEQVKSLYIKELFEKQNKSVLLVTSSLYEANKFYQDLTNYTDEVLLFPMDDFLTSEAIAASPELKVNRLETINEILLNNKKIVITNLMGFLRFLPPEELFETKKINLTVNNEYNITNLKEKLFELGYKKEVTVSKTGEMAVRGFVLDIFPISSNNPIRIEFWGDQIESIREFDVNTQLTVDNINNVQISSITEFLIDKPLDNFNIKQRDLIKYIKPKSIANFLDGYVIFNDYEQLKITYSNLIEEIHNYSLSENLPSNIKFMFDFNELEDKLPDIKYFSNFDNHITNNLESYNSFPLDKFPKDKDGINKVFTSYLKKYHKVYLLCDSNKNINKLIDYLENPNIVLTNFNNYVENKINLIKYKISKGFIFENIVYISENDIFNNNVNQEKFKSKFKLGIKIKDANKLNIGDYVVHFSHGVGRYLGIKTLLKNGLKKDYLTIEYKDSDKLYIPVEKIDYINKYSSNEGYTPKLNKLGSGEWEKTKLRTRKKIEDIAKDLLKLYALRESTPGFSFLEDTKEQYEFEKEFKFQETNDQLKVIDEIKKDMEKSVPMDRLLCGDVGYGKTEVAFRAIFKAIMSGKQTAILCPTTILSNQHFNNAIDRFKSFPINIEILNRFVTPKKVSSIIKRLEEGKIDLLIGTHRILSDDIKFKDLGLLVIDEEQRFGVKHKEKIKEYKNNVDVLTLSATPIPRTLQMSMSGLRNLSLIETPPVDRYPIQTYVLSENKAIIKDAIYKELSRNGQCFILFNNIGKMEEKRQEILQLIPDAKIVCAHGKMSKQELEEIMENFVMGEFNILLCTTIIETGIDIPNVNTLIIFDADHFGLSQLYQIRGRVGRSNKIAYCYLMYDKSKVLSEVAIKRLNAIKEFTELGSGFAIAMRDLAIRGAGDILGSEQAGFIDTVGIELFMQMLEEEIAKLKGEEIENKEEKINAMPIIDVSTSISNNYVEDEELKIELHKKINSIDSLEALNKIKNELEDRFGKLSEDLIIYMHEEWLEKLATTLNIKNIRQGKNSIEITIPKEIVETLDGQKLFIGVSRISRMFRFSKRGNNLIIILDIVKLDKHFVYYLIELFELIKKIKTA